jgi:hypothetical protein
MSKQINLNSNVTTKLVNAVIDQAIQHTKTMRESIQHAALLIIIHAHKCGDYSKANALINGLGDGVRKASLVDWFVKHGGLIIDEKAANGFTSWQGKEFIADKFEAGKAKPWYECKPEGNGFGRERGPSKGYDLEEDIKKLLNKASKQRAKVAQMSEEGKAKYSFAISDDTMQRMTALFGDELEVINGETVTTNDDVLSEEENVALQAALAG